MINEFLCIFQIVRLFAKIKITMTCKFLHAFKLAIYYFLIFIVFIRRKSQASSRSSKQSLKAYM